MNEFLEKIRASDDAAKKRWLIVFTVPAMVLVAIVWAIALKSDLTLQSGSEADNRSNFVQSWEIFKRGLSVAGQKVEDGSGNFTANVSERLLRSKEVNRQNFKFSEKLEPIIPKRLDQ